MAQQQKMSSRTLLLVAGIAVIVVAGRPAWNRLNAYTSLQPVHTAIRDGDLETAVSLLEDIKSSDVQPAEVAYLLAVTNRRLGRLKPAFDYLQKAEDLGWSVEDITRQRYMARFQAGDIDGTRDYLQGLLTRGANDAVAEEIYEALSKGFLSEFRIGDAMVVLDHWLAWRPNAYRALEWRAQLYDQDEDWQKSVKCYQKIVEINPDNTSARLHLADALIEDHHVEEAKAQYAEALRRSPDEPLARFGLAVCARRLSDSAGAIKWLEEILANQPNPRIRAEVLFELGQIAMESSDFELAVKRFTDGLELYPNSSLTHHSLGRAYGILRKDDLAKKHFDIATELSNAQRRMEKALAEAKASPGNVKVRLEVAKLLLAQGNDEDAASWLATILNLDPQHAEAREMLNNLLRSRRESESGGSLKVGQAGPEGSNQQTE